jgi:putative flippase GtrA
MAKYGVVASINAALQILISNYLFYYQNFEGKFAAAIGIGVSTIVGFTCMRFWVFDE